MAIPSGTGQTTEHVLPKGTVVIAGGGPVGLILATVLSYYGVHSILFERNKTTTHWPKMDLTNSRSMELFRKLGLADELRKQGVPSNYSLDVLFSNGMDSPDVLTKWDLPSVDEMMERIKQKNDGSMPLEPNQRMSQVVFERWLKEVCEKDERVDLRYGHRVDGVEEIEGGKVTTKVTEVDSGVETVYVSEYVAGCDGGGSRVRRSLDLPVDGGPM
jgi:FAD-dependent monooxygenase